MKEAPEEDVLTLFGEEIPLGTHKVLNFNIAKLYTHTKIDIPIIISRANEPGPTILITAGIHGDEVNGIDIVRQFVAQKLNRPTRGTIICIPVVNVFGFLSMNRYFPDGRDLNRVFPGSKTGALASRLAYQFSTEVLKQIDLCLDFHTGGRSLFNVPQIRIQKDDPTLESYAKLFDAPFTLFSNQVKGTFRAVCAQKGVPSLLFEGGKSECIDPWVSQEGLKGILRILKAKKMLTQQGITTLHSLENQQETKPTTLIHKSSWLRANSSGMFHPKVKVGDSIEKGDLLAEITDPYGSSSVKIKANHQGHIITLNESPIIYQGDAIVRLSKPYL